MLLMGVVVEHNHKGKIMVLGVDKRIYLDNVVYDEAQTIRSGLQFIYEIELLLLIVELDSLHIVKLVLSQTKTCNFNLLLRLHLFMQK